MKKLIIILALAALPGLIFAGGAVIRDFTASPLGQQVYLVWNTNPGAPATGFQVQRSLDGQRYYNIADIAALPGSSRYTYLDNDLFKGELSIYYYRIAATLPTGGSEVSDPVAVSLSFSGIQRTWGSIKAMFR